MLCHVPYSDPPVLACQLENMLERLAPAAARVTVDPHAGKCPELDQAHASLSNAWGTELLLAFGGEVPRDDELVRLMTNWAVVQAYYAAYHAMQAVVVARGNPRPESHPKTQALFSDHWTSRPIGLLPWSLGACDGGWRNPPREIKDVHPWAGCDPHSCLDLAAKAARTTRDDAVTAAERRARDRKQTAAKKAWQEEETERLGRGKKARKVPSFPRPLLKADEKAKVRSRVRSYSVLDYLYRLRVKTNYEDANMFVEGPIDHDESLHLHGNLVELTSATMLVHELQVGACVGSATLVAWVDDWLSRNSAGQNVGLGRRRDLLAVHVP
jgi:hypothetical protein